MTKSVREDNGETGASRYEGEGAVKLVRQGDYLAEVDVEMIYTDDGWSPYLCVSDAEKLDTVRVALRRGDFKVASELARVFELVPLAA